MIFLKLCFAALQDSEYNASAGELMASQIINSKALPDFEKALIKENGENEKAIKDLEENIQDYSKNRVDANLYASQEQDSTIIKLVIMKLLDQIEKIEFLCKNEDLKSRRKSLLTTLKMELEYIEAAELELFKNNGGQNTEIVDI